jgi:2',3'-cyclic-nucleotide 2'-phosphodiesterase (5'-nucleotidase family)
MVPDAAIDAMLEKYRQQLAPKLGKVLAYSPIALSRLNNCKHHTDSGGTNCEQISGNMIADAMLRTHPNAQIAFFNVNSIRGSFTCVEPKGEGFCPANQTSVAPFAITVGTIRNVLPYDSGVCVCVCVFCF